MDVALERAFGIGENDPMNPVERIAQCMLDDAEGNPAVALRLACGALMLAEKRQRHREHLISRGYVRQALDDLGP